MDHSDEYDWEDSQDVLDTHAEEIFLDILSGLSALADEKLNIRYPNAYDMMLALGKEYNVNIREIELEG